MPRNSHSSTRRVIGTSTSVPDGSNDITNGFSSLVVDISKLPPLPTPKQMEQRRETRLGIKVVFFTIVLCVGLTHGIALTAVQGIEKYSAPWWVFLILIYSEAGIALTCLAGLLVKDPGIVKRSPETCFPIPIQMEPWIKAHLETIENNNNNNNTENNVEPPDEHYICSPDGDDTNNNKGTYCVRCLVWRKPKPRTRYFHCQTCERCVEHFDHHCNVFGRCIAGTIWKGNLKYYVMIVIVFQLGFWTTAVSMAWSLIARFLF